MKQLKLRDMMWRLTNKMKIKVYQIILASQTIIILALLAYIFIPPTTVILQKGIKTSLGREYRIFMAGKRKDIGSLIINDDGRYT